MDAPRGRPRAPHAAPEARPLGPVPICCESGRAPAHSERAGLPLPQPAFPSQRSRGNGAARALDPRYICLGSPQRSPPPCTPLATLLTLATSALSHVCCPHPLHPLHRTRRPPLAARAATLTLTLTLTTVFSARDDLKNAVDEWLVGTTDAETKYGHIINWATAGVTKPNVAGKLAEFEHHPVACPPQWLPAILASTPWPPTHRRRLSNYKFANKADLKEAAQEYNANSLTATDKYGPVATWDVSKISNMRELFKGLESFDADISSWNTSGVTDMSRMFEARFACSLPTLLAPRSPTALSPPDRACVLGTPAFSRGPSPTHVPLGPPPPQAHLSASPHLARHRMPSL